MVYSRYDLTDSVQARMLIDDGANPGRRSAFGLLTVETQVRVLIINHTPLEGSGSGTYVRSIADGLASLGHEAHTLTIGPKDRVTTRGRRVDTVRSVTLPGLQAGIFPSFTGHRLSRQLYKDLSALQLSSYVEQCSSILRDALGKERYDIIHVQHVFVLMDVAGTLGIPVVATCHGAEVDLALNDQTGLIRQFVTRAINKPRRIICVSDFVRQRLRRLSGAETNLMVLLNGYNSALFHLGSSVNTIRRYVTCGGRHVAHKNLSMAMLASERAAAMFGGSLELVVFGDGPLTPSLQQLATSFTSCRARLTGYLTDSELVELFRSTELLLMPAFEEPFGLIPLESAACGACVLAANSGGLPEFVDARLGRLVDGWDVDVWAEAILSTRAALARGNWPAEQVGAAARARDWDAYVRDLLSIYRTAMDSDSRISS